nr:hypothetical protein [Paenibacillus bovis]
MGWRVPSSPVCRSISRRGNAGDFHRAWYIVKMVDEVTLTVVSCPVGMKSDGRGNAEGLIVPSGDEK